MTIHKRIPRNEVVSLRLNEHRLELLERYRRALADELGRDVSLSEAVFLAIEGRATRMDRTAARAELLKTPTASLVRIRTQWESQHALSAAEWDVLAEYVRIADEEYRQERPMTPIPSREASLALLDAFEAVYTHRIDRASRHAWAYFGNLGGGLAGDTFPDTDLEQQHQAVLTHIARRRASLQSIDRWERPGNVGHCFWVAVREEGVDSRTLDQLLAPYWRVLWRLAARGHWIRHHHALVRLSESGEAPRALGLPPALTADALTVSFEWSGGSKFCTLIEFGSGGLQLQISRYPELVEWRAMLERDPDRPWIGRYFVAEAEQAPRPGAHRVVVLQRELNFRVSVTEWAALRDLFRRAWQSPELQQRLVELQLEYGYQG